MLMQESKEEFFINATYRALEPDTLNALNQSQLSAHQLESKDQVRTS